mmetsp:Transcript_32388/g.70104  ORF Transcript_32388/g.70104 Transcript_32388/m.70104 type:complete len:99 (+) Transcript_32388:890-1186(+)
MLRSVLQAFWLSLFSLLCSSRCKKAFRRMMRPRTRLTAEEAQGRKSLHSSPRLLGIVYVMRAGRVQAGLGRYLMQEAQKARQILGESGTAGSFAFHKS